MRKIFIGSILTAFFIFHSFRISEASEVSELKEQLRQFQQENAQLREKLDKQAEATDRLLERIEVLEAQGTTLTRDVKTLKEKPPEPVLEKEAVKPGFTLPKLHIMGFMDMSYKIKHEKDGTTKNAFSWDQLAFHLSSELTDRVSVFNELVLEFEESGEIELDVERLYIKYSLSDLFNLKFGRIHTALGYWNTVFHHGKWLQTSVFRPEMLKFEDDGGILPIHSSGLELSGTKTFSAFGLEYALGVSNGRGKVVTEIQQFQDGNDSKAVNLLLAIKPDSIPGLKAGVNAYLDRIPKDTSVASRNGEIKELIWGGYLAYLYDNIEVLAEIANVRHDDSVSGKDFDTLGLYFQGAYKFGKLKPYYRFDYIDFGNGDPFYAPNDVDISKHTVGLKWDIFTWNALKFEYGFADKKRRGNEHSFVINSSFTF